MVWNISYWAKVGQRILYVLLLLLGLYIGIKLSSSIYNISYYRTGNKIYNEENRDN